MNYKFRKFMKMAYIFFDGNEKCRNGRQKTGDRSKTDVSSVALAKEEDRMCEA